MAPPPPPVEFAGTFSGGTRAAVNGGGPHAVEAGTGGQQNPKEEDEYDLETTV